MKSRKRIIQLLVFLIILCILGVIVQKMDLTVEDLLEWTPSDPLLAFFVIMGFFAFKSLLIVLPIPLLYLLNGHFFSTLTAVLVNLCGIAVSCSEQYLIGKKHGISSDNDTLNLVRNLQADNPFFSTYLLRMFQLPMDLVSMFSGMEHVPFLPYLAGSLVGMSPVMIGITITGDDILSPKSPEFLTSVLWMIVIIAASFVVFFLILHFFYPEKISMMKKLLKEKMPHRKG